VRAAPAALVLTTALAAAGTGTAVSAAAVESYPLACRAVPFTETAAAAGIDFVHRRGESGDKQLPETMGAGVAWLDFDGDGWLDLYAVQSGPFPPAGDPGAANRLFRNRGDGTFEDWTDRAGVGHRGYGQGVLAADLDGDGSTDLYLTDFGPDAFLRNRGDGTFADATAAAGLGAGGWSSSAAAADADGDGDLDLYVARYLVYDPAADVFCGDAETGERSYCDPSIFAGAGDLFYRNRGDGTFADATAAAGLGGAQGRGLGVVFSDLDGDGRPDLYVANDLTLNLLFRNRGDGTFEDLSLVSGAAVDRAGKPEAGMGIGVGDFDGDGDPDLVVTNFDVETNDLYDNLGGMQFEDRSAASGFGPPSFNLLGFGVAVADFDLDGDLDAFVADGHIFERPRRDNVRYAQPELLLAGDGRGRFRAETCAAGAGGLTVGRGLAAADYDGDGDPDLALAASGGPLALLRNDVRGRPWLGVVLRGRGANPQAVGARAVLTTTGGRRQSRWVLAGDSYQSTSDRRLLFAWPDGDQPAALTVTWPSGETLRLAAPAAGRYLVVGPPG
jgi:enediyne biosynthesis protein E4